MYTKEQWNGRDSLSGLGVSQLGQRLYDPVLGRFLSRDPLRVVRGAATTNAYAFALNDPLNRTDPTGLDSGDGGCRGRECTGPSAADVWAGGAPGWDLNDPRLYLPRSDATSQPSPQASYRAEIPTVFLNTPIGPPHGPRCVAGRNTCSMHEDDEPGAEGAEGHGGGIGHALHATHVVVDVVELTLGLAGVEHSHWAMRTASGASAALGTLGIIEGLGEVGKGHTRQGLGRSGVSAVQLALVGTGPLGTAISLWLGLMSMEQHGPEPVVDPELMRLIIRNEPHFYDEQARAYDDWYYSVMSTCWAPNACGNVPGLLEWNIRNFNPTIFGQKVYENSRIMEYDLDFPIVRDPARVWLDEQLKPVYRPY
jgi:RHS repeat-associated protein